MARPVLAMGAGRACVRGWRVERRVSIIAVCCVLCDGTGFGEVLVYKG